MATSKSVIAWGVAAAIAATAGLTPAFAPSPALASPMAKSPLIAADPITETVSWRGRRNTALVAGALGLTALGIAAAAASQPRYGYDRYGYGPGYGYRPSYGYRPYAEDFYEYAPPRRRVPVYVDPYAGGYDIYAPPPRRRHSAVRQPYFHDYGAGFQRGRDPAGSN